MDEGIQRRWTTAARNSSLTVAAAGLLEYESTRGGALLPASTRNTGDEDGALAAVVPAIVTRTRTMTIYARGYTFGRRAAEAQRTT